MNKKAFFNTPNFWAIVILILAIIIIVIKAPGVFGGKANTDSNTALVPGCDAPVMSVKIAGDLKVEDTAIIGVKAEALEIVVNDVINIYRESLFIAQPLRGFTRQNYHWKVHAINTRTNAVTFTTKGANLHEGGDVQSNPFSVYISVPDNDCDSQIDDFDVMLKGEVITDDNEKSEVTKMVRFEDDTIK